MPRTRKDIITWSSRAEPLVGGPSFGACSGSPCCTSAAACGCFLLLFLWLSWCVSVAVFLCASSCRFTEEAILAYCQWLNCQILSFPLEHIVCSSIFTSKKNSTGRGREGIVRSKQAFTKPFLKTPVPPNLTHDRLSQENCSPPPD